MAIDTSLATCVGHRPSGGRSFRKQRTVNPLMVPARYNFLYSSSRPALRAAASGGRPRPSALTRREDWLTTVGRLILPERDISPL
jgi:hypothetical protein